VQQATHWQLVGAEAYSVKAGLFANISILLLAVLNILIDALSLNVNAVLLEQHVGGVVGVLHFHSGVAGDIDNFRNFFGIVGAEFAHAPVHVEGGVGLGLAVGDAQLLGSRLGGESFGVDAVEVALAEEELGQARMLERSFLLHGRHY